MTGDPTCTLLDRWLVNTDRHTGEKTHGKKNATDEVHNPHTRKERGTQCFFFFCFFFFLITGKHRQVEKDSDLGQMCELVTST